MIESYQPHPTSLGELPIWRALPLRQRRMIGPWCFLDRYGPISFTGDKPMDVAPHPHIGLQTVSWLLEGEVIHHDTLGYEALVRPGGVNVMTSGRGIAHAEETPRANIGRLNGVQLWIALPGEQRHVSPAFDHIAEVPRDEIKGGILQHFMPAANAFSDLVGLDVEVHARETLTIPLTPAREHGIFVLAGDVTLEAQPLPINTLHYLGTGRDEASLRSANGARLLLFGGVPFAEKILMWWNFVARTPEEITAARTAWQAGEFGEVRDYAGPRIEAPPLHRLAAPNPAS